MYTERLGWQCNVRALAETPAVVVGGWKMEVRKACDVWEKLKDTAHTGPNNAASFGLGETAPEFK